MPEYAMKNAQTDQPGRFRATLALLLLIAGLYLLLHPYKGLIHDARLYTLQALNYLHPDLYRNDVFLKYGSQDSYTLFTPIYGTIMSLLGAESAASLVTFLSTLALLSGAWFLARQLMPSPVAWIGLGVLVVAPSFYGCGVTFAVLEEFVTPRLIAEALALWAISAWLRKQWTLCGVALFSAFLLHPIMTLPAIILIAVMSWGIQHWRVLLTFLLSAAVLATAIAVGLVSIAHWQFDADWWPMADRVPHLILSHWTWNDWSRIATISVTLAIGAFCLPPESKRLCLGVLITVAGSLLLSWIGGDLLRIVLVVQGQAWRALWLETAAAALLLPWIAITCWNGPPLRRCSVLLLTAAWVLGAQDIALLFSIAAAVATAFSTIRIEPRYARLAQLVSVAALAVVILCVSSLTVLKLLDAAAPYEAAEPLGELRSLCADGVLPAVALLSLSYLATRVRSRPRLGLFTLLMALPVVWITKASAPAWFHQDYPRSAKEAFSGWRALIPAGSDVLWATKFKNGSDPMGAWLLLERPSYFSSVQINSGLFSRAAALELHRRSKTIPLSLPTEMPIDIVFADKTGSTGPSCQEIPARYVITNIAIPDAKVIHAPSSVPPPFDRLELRLCP